MKIVEIAGEEPTGEIGIWFWAQCVVRSGSGSKDANRCDATTMMRCNNLSLRLCGDEKK